MTEEQFRQLTEEDIPCALFHVEPKDRDDETGGRLDETILVNIISFNKGCLKYKPLQWFLDTYLISEEKWDEMMQKNLTESQKEEQKLFHDILEDERNEEWIIGHPGTGERIECKSFEECMEKWFEGFNMPFLYIGGERESFETAHERVKKYFEK